MMNRLFNKTFYRYNSHMRSMSIDVHTHMYTPKYMDILKKRIDIPRVIMINNQARLVILPGEDKEITTSIGGLINLYLYNPVMHIYVLIHINNIFINYPSILLSIHPLIYQSYLSPISHLSIYMHIIFIFLYIQISFHLSIYPPTHPFIYLYPSTHPLIIHLCIYPYIYLYPLTHLAIYLSISS